MGIAILNVLVLHSLSWTGFNSPGWGAILLTTFGRLVFTEGFLFLSGFGLYYSLHKSYDLRLFFTKRIQRLLIPYWLMSLPFFVIWLVGGRFGISGLLMRLSTLEFWFHGNYVGMWYISLSVLLYAFMPLMFRGIRWWGGAGSDSYFCHYCFVSLSTRVLQYDQYRNCQGPLFYLWRLVR